ncbi:hypothetical protein C4K40_4178 [Pseudomonas sp. CMR5c]|nr:hypothetical protein [Pseudomonas sp. CMR5c]AZC19559.1 hypothetical protein C4K40_4178 [Pseudomonas sp. CMR5c]
MRLIGARQAWREALHEGRDSVLGVAADRAALGKRGRVVGETMESMLDSNGRCAHILAAGLVQAAIDSLPKPLQHLGHALYSPVSTGQDLNIAHGLVWFTTVLPECNARRRELAYWMALAAVKSHQGVVYGRDGWGPARVCEFVQDWYGARMSPSHWARDWAAIWEAICKAVDNLDKKALKPVAAVVARMNGRHRPGWCRWEDFDREAVADARAAAYDRRRPGLVTALQARLSGLEEAALRQWFFRMQAYAAAYREEWGTDVLENPGRHQRYQDRVTEYWNQRQRVGDVVKRVA